jgi:hypothetical protein
MTLNFGTQTIFRRSIVDRGMHKAEVDTVDVPDSDALVELREHPFTLGLMRLATYPSHTEGWVGGARVIPPTVLYRDSENHFGILVRSND